MTKLRRRSAVLDLKPTDLRTVMLSWLRARKEATQKTYRRDLSDFAAWYLSYSRHKVVAKPDEEQVGEVLVELFSQPVATVNAVVLGYVEDLLTRKVWSSPRDRDAGRPPDRTGLAPNTVNRRLSALKAIAKLARATGAFSGNIEVSGVPVRAYRNTLGIGEEGYHALLEAIAAKVKEYRDIDGGYGWAKYPRAVRDLAILRLLHDAGLRRVEVVRLRMQDVVEKHQAIVLQPKGAIGDTLEWELGAAPWGALQAWLKIRGPEPGALFHGIGRPPHQHMNLSTVNRLIRDRGDESGLHVRPHDLRHTAITTALDRTDGNIRDVQKFSRHKNIKTVTVYDDRRRGVARGVQDLISEKKDEL